MADAEPPRRRSQSERSEAMRRRLLDAAREVAQVRGFARLRMAEVAEAAGVSIGAQLHHFPSKNALIIALFEDVYGSMVRQAQRRQRRPKTLEAALRGLIEDSRDFFFGEPFTVSLDISISATRDAELRDQVLKIIAGHRKDVEAMWIERLRAFDVPHAQAVDALWLINSAIRGLAVRAIWDPDVEKFRRVEALCETLLLPYLRAHMSLPG